jgi:hypothetical protein
MITSRRSNRSEIGDVELGAGQARDVTTFERTVQVDTEHPAAAGNQKAGHTAGVLTVRLEP